MNIKTWQERIRSEYHNMPPIVGPYMQSEIDELRAENERLEGSEIGLNRYLAKVQSESRELRTENFRLTAELGDLPEAQAEMLSEVKRLKQYIGKASFASNGDRHAALECVANIALVEREACAKICEAREENEPAPISTVCWQLADAIRLRSKNNALEMEVSCLPEMRDELSFLRARIAALEGQEPVGYVYSVASNPGEKSAALSADIPNGTPLYTAAGAKGEMK